MLLWECADSRFGTSVRLWMKTWALSDWSSAKSYSEILLKFEIYWNSTSSPFNWYIQLYVCPHHLKTLVHSGLGLTPQKNCSLTESPYIHSTLSFRRGLGSKELRLSLSGVKLYEAVRLVLSTMFRWKIQFALSVFSMIMTCTQFVQTSVTTSIDKETAFS